MTFLFSIYRCSLCDNKCLSNYFVLVINYEPLDPTRFFKEFILKKSSQELKLDRKRFQVVRFKFFFFFNLIMYNVKLKHLLKRLWGMIATQ